MRNGNMGVKYGLWVWEKKWNKMMNMKGGEMMVWDVGKMEGEKKKVKIDVVLNDGEVGYVWGYMNVVEKVKVKMKGGYE